MQKILVLLGTNRPNRNGPKVAEWFMNAAGQDPRFSFELVDLQQLNLPWLDEPIPSKVTTDYVNEHTKNWSKKIASADGYVIITPEYNHSYAAVLKNALDYLYYEWGQKPIAFVGYGAEYGSRAIEHLRQIAVKLKMAPMSHQVGINIFSQQKNGKFEPSVGNQKQLEAMLNQLHWWATALSKARAEQPYPDH